MPQQRVKLHEDPMLHCDSSDDEDSLLNQDKINETRAKLGKNRRGKQPTVTRSLVQTDAAVSDHEAFLNN